MVAAADIQLVEQIRQGDTAGLAALHDKYADEIWRVTLMRVKDPDVAWEIVQETFLRAGKHLRSFEGGDRAAHWLHRVAKNLSTDHHRRQRRMAPGPVLEFADEPECQPEAVLIRSSEHRLVRQAFARLSPEDQALLWARDVEGQSVDDLAAERGITNGSMCVKLVRVRGRLRVHAAGVGLSSLLPPRMGWPWSAELVGRASALLPSLALAFGAILSGVDASPTLLAPDSVDPPRVRFDPSASALTVAGGKPHLGEVAPVSGNGAAPMVPESDKRDGGRGLLPRTEVGDEPPAEAPVATVDLTPCGVPIRVDLWAPVGGSTKGSGGRGAKEPGERPSVCGTDILNEG